jgi:predicted nucleic acid-binding protein
MVGRPAGAAGPMKALFDTNILIDYLNGLEAADAEFRCHTQKLISVVTWMEMQIGARTEAEADVIDLFLRDFTVIDLSRRVAREAIAARKAYRMRLPDAVILASAHVESALLVTRNTKDFPRDLPGIRVPYSV